MICAVKKKKNNYIKEKKRHNKLIQHVLDKINSIFMCYKKISCSNNFLFKSFFGFFFFKKKSDTIT